MPGLDVNILTQTARNLPQARLDGGVDFGVGMRGGRYKELFVMSAVPTKHLLADEGTYFTANNAQTALTFFSSANTFQSSAPFLTIFNNDSPSSPTAKRVYVDYVALTVGTASTATGFNIAVYKDTNPARVTVNGVTLTSNNVNTAGNKSITTVTFGSTLLSATANGPTATAIVGQRSLRSGANMAGGDVYALVSGFVDQSVVGSNVTGGVMIQQMLPPIVIGPQETMLFYAFGTAGSSVTAGTAFPEVSFWER